MLIAGITVEVRPCQHCNHARVWWFETDAGHAPELAFSGFPEDGVLVLSKSEVIVVCRQCAPAVESMKDDAIKGASRQ